MGSFNSRGRCCRVPWISRLLTFLYVVACVRRYVCKEVRESTRVCYVGCTFPRVYAPQEANVENEYWCAFLKSSRPRKMLDPLSHYAFFLKEKEKEKEKNKTKIIKKRIKGITLSKFFLKGFFISFFLRFCFHIKNACLLDNAK